jgi:polysaccharide deacetylase 2 family uncharacterized protein YibQ
MVSRKKRTKKRKIKIKKKYYCFFFLVLFLLAAFFSYREFTEESFYPKKASGTPPHKELIHKVNLESKDVHVEIVKDVEHKEKLVVTPKVAIVIDDLGHNKKPILGLLKINVPLTLSILPHATYSAWIANEGYRQGHDIIGHIPMEAKEGNRMGKGGLYTWMSDNEIRRILKEDLESIPHIRGISNHMGSSFTENGHVMDIVLSVLKERQLFFLDSLTTVRSVGEKIARDHGVKTLKRDIFLDNKDVPAYIEAQWKKLLKIADKKGSAIVLAHPRKNTIEFLERVLPKKEVTFVTLSHLIPSD